MAPDGLRTDMLEKLDVSLPPFRNPNAPVVKTVERRVSTRRPWNQVRIVDPEVTMRIE